jgi:hypothetical protein
MRKTPARQFAAFKMPDFRFRRGCAHPNIPAARVQVERLFKAATGKFTMQLVLLEEVFANYQVSERVLQQFSVPTTRVSCSSTW